MFIIISSMMFFPFPQCSISPIKFIPSPSSFCPRRAHFDRFRGKLWSKQSPQASATTRLNRKRVWNKYGRPMHFLTLSFDSSVEREFKIPPPPEPWDESSDDNDKDGDGEKDGVNGVEGGEKEEDLEDLTPRSRRLRERRKLIDAVVEKEEERMRIEAEKKKEAEELEVGMQKATISARKNLMKGRKQMKGEQKFFSKAL